ncbi:MAG: hypothetical protein V4581_01810 [Bacteroidota bacterium]
MKTKLINTALFALFSIGGIFAQDVTTVTANNTDISDNLDLQAVASIFGESSDLEDFERRLNNPDTQISNLDLNGDSRVDYLRVIEATESNTHLIILQAVLAADTFQDVATIEVERDSNNNVSVQVVGDVYMYGQNYIYEPVYASPPVIYNVFWASTYRPYYSPWYWGYYPTYYTYWRPFPIYRYRNHIHNHINVHNNYVYVQNRRSTRAVNLYGSRRQNAYERQHPNTSFANRNNNVGNRHKLEQNRAVATNRGNGTRSATNASRGTTSQTGNSRNTLTTSRGSGTTTEPRVTRANTATRSESKTVRSTTPARTATPSVNSGNSKIEGGNTPSVRATTPSRTNSTPAIRNTPQATPQRQSSPAVRSTPQATPQRQSTPAVRNTPQAAPQRQSTPAVRSTPQAAPQRQSSPQAAPQRQSTPANGGGRRG